MTHHILPICRTILFVALLSLGVFEHAQSEELQPADAFENFITKQRLNTFKDISLDKKYSISYFVVKPGDGKSDKVFVGQDAGHSFIRLIKFDPDGYVRETLSFGLYPDFDYLPVFRERGPSVLRNNEFNHWDYKRSNVLSLQQFNNILDYAMEIADGSEYDLQDYNCTDFVIRISSFTNNPLPDTQKRWPLGKGSTPVALAQDIAILNGGNKID